MNSVKWPCSPWVFSLVFLVLCLGRRLCRITRPCTGLMIYRLPSQERPSPSYPSSHSHSNDPSVFTQVACWPQSSWWVSHSSKSLKDKELKWDSTKQHVSYIKDCSNLYCNLALRPPGTPIVISLDMRVHPGRSQCVLFLDEALLSHSASFHSDVWVGALILEGNPAMV